jgi:hypothetical protein
MYIDRSDRTAGPTKERAERAYFTILVKNKMQGE